MLHPGTLTKDFLLLLSFKKRYTFFLCHSVSYCLTANLVINDLRNWILNNMYLFCKCLLCIFCVQKTARFIYLLFRV